MTSPPETSNTIVVGGGIFGLGAAISLQNRGHAVTLFDRLSIPAEDGSSNDINRIVRMDYGAKSLEQELAMRAVQKWREWTKKLDSSSMNEPPLFDECGILLTCPDEQLGPYERACLDHLTSMGYRDCVRELSASQIVEKFPAFSHATSHLKSAYFNTIGGWVNANRAVQYMHALALEAGVQIIAGGDAGSVRQLLEDGGRVVGVRTADNVSHYGDAVLVSAGAWSASIVPELASIIVASGQPVIYVRVPEELKERYSSKSFPVWTADIAKTGMFGFPAYDRLLKFACHSLGFINPTVVNDSGLSVSLPRTTVDSPSDTIPEAKFAEMKLFIDTHFPELKDAPITKAKLCWYCNTFDERFLISSVPNRPGLFVATGGSGHAFKFAPVLGDIVADVVMGVDNEETRSFVWRENPMGKTVYMPNGDGILAENSFVRIVGERG